jgi:hypothetical protein
MTDFRPPPKRHWRSYGTDALPMPAEALAEPLSAFPSWFVARQSGWRPYCLILECCREHIGCLIAMFPLHHLRQLRVTPDP